MALTGLAVLTLLKQRADRREFHLPFGDGSVILAAGLWAGLLIVVRLFDRPLGQSVLALACAALLAAAGLRERAKRPMDDLPPPPVRPPPAAPAEAATERDTRRRGSHDAAAGRAAARGRATETKRGPLDARRSETRTPPSRHRSRTGDRRPTPTNPGPPRRELRLRLGAALTRRVPWGSRELPARAVAGVDLALGVADPDQAEHAADGHQAGRDRHRQVEGGHRLVGIVAVLGGHDRADDRDPQQPGHPRDGVVDAACQAGVVLVGVGQDGGGERRDGHRQAQREDQQRRQQLGHVVEVGLDLGQQRHPNGGDDRAHAHEEARAEAVRHGAEAGGREEHDDRDREACQPGLGGAVAGRVLEEQHQEEEEQRQPGVHRQRLDVADGEVVALEQVQLEHRMRASALDQEEGDKAVPGRPRRGRTPWGRRTRPRAGG